MNEMAKERVSKRKNLLTDIDEMNRRISNGNKAERLSLVRSFLEQQELDVHDIELNIPELREPADLDLDLIRDLAVNIGG